MVCTDSEVLYENLIMARAHGWSRNNSKEFKKHYEKKYNISEFYSQFTFYTIWFLTLGQLKLMDLLVMFK